MTRSSSRPGHLPRRIAWIPLAFLLLLQCPPSDSWRSTLYPENWQPGYKDSEGRFLHDFSYAGYRNGEAALPSNPPGSIYDVVAAFGADNTGVADATGPIQQAVSSAGAAGGGIVYLPAGLYRLDGLLTITRSGVVIRGAGVGQTQVYFTQAAGMSGRAHITFSGNVSQGLDLPLADDGVNQSTTVTVADAASLEVGDDVSVGWVITDEFVAEHGMTGVWTAFNGQWKPFFRRKVVAVNLGASPNEVTLDVPLRYPAKLRDAASLRKETGYLTECGIESLSVGNAVDWQVAWNETRVHLLLIQFAKDCWVKDVHSFEPANGLALGYHLQNGGMRIWGSKRITVVASRLEKAQNRGDGGCGYLFEIGASNEVLVRDCQGIAGRHNFIQNWDFGTTGCVFLRCESAEGRCLLNANDTIGTVCYSEYHHSLAMANLVDQSTLKDGWYGGNRNLWSTGAGQTATENAYWNTQGGGTGYLKSWAYGWGYVIGTKSLSVMTTLTLGGTSAVGTAPQDWTEGLNSGDLLVPQSLYEDQLARRLAR